jgi:glucarate dehydratase
MAPPKGVGLGVELDREQLGKLHENYLRGEGRVRDDTAEMQKRGPYYLPLRPRW